MILTVLDMAKMGLLSLDQQFLYSVHAVYSPFFIGGWLQMSV